MQELGVFLQTVNFNKLKKISTFEIAPTKICPAYSLNKTEWNQCQLSADFHLGS